MKSSEVFIQLLKQDLNVVAIPEHKFHPTRKWKFDYAIIDKKIAIEVEGGAFTNGRHTRGVGFINDMEKDNEAVILGWRLIRVTPTQLLTNKTVNFIKRLL